MVIQASTQQTSYADVAQLAEQLICNQQVIGSSPIIGFYGWIPEWPKGPDCKSAATCFGGSNPPLPILLKRRNNKIVTRDGAVWKLVGLITRRSQVQILLPQLQEKRHAETQMLLFFSIIKKQFLEICFFVVWLINLIYQTVNVRYCKNKQLML